MAEVLDCRRYKDIDSEGDECVLCEGKIEDYELVETIDRGNGLIHKVCWAEREKKRIGGLEA